MVSKNSVNSLIRKDQLIKRIGWYELQNYFTKY